MRPGVVSNQVSLSLFAPHDLRVLLRSYTNHEESGSYFLLSEYVEQPGSIDRVGAVVEGERHAAPVPTIHRRAVGHQPLVARMEQQVQHDRGARRVDRRGDQKPPLAEGVQEHQGHIRQHEQQHEGRGSRHASVILALAARAEEGARIASETTPNRRLTVGLRFRYANHVLLYTKHSHVLIPTLEDE